MNIRLGGLALAALASLGAAHGENAHVSFVTCPIFRDGDRQCWLAEHGGRTYYIGRVGQAQPPELLHKVLVEGKIAEGELSCGAIVVEPVTLSVLPEVDYSCNTVLPDNGEAPNEPSIFDIPAEVQLRIGSPQPDPQGPFADKVVSVTFGHGSTFLHQISQRTVEQAFRYARAGSAIAIEIIGQAADTRLDNGQTMTEPARLAEQRVRMVEDALVRLGWDRTKLKVDWRKQVAAGDGVEDAARRNVQITIRMPGDASR